MQSVSRLKVFIAVALLFTAQSALAQLLNFEELHPKFELNEVGQTYGAVGYTFFYAPAPDEPIPTALYYAGRMWRFNDGSTALFANSDNASVTLKRDDGRPFAMVALDLAELNGGGASPLARVDFEALTSSGITVTHTIEMDNQTGFQRFFMPPTFRDVTVVRWFQGDNVNNAPHMFDNVLLMPNRP
jgi:hypothetical protein